MNTLTNLLGIEEQESTKVCRKCNKDLPISSFRTRGEGKIQRRIDLVCIICKKREHKIRRDLRKTAPPPPELKGGWYSKKTAFVDMSGGGSGVIRQNKEDGYAIGTVIPILKDSNDGSESDPMDQYGELK